ncbi:MAG: TonB-dependent receptor domain-containing protein [Gemmatimonadaceae bacterium]
MIRSKFKHFARTFSVLLGIIAVAAGNLVAQNTTGTVRGSVTGEGGAPMGSAQVIARNVSTGIVRGTQANDAGSYTLVGLVPGTYDFTVRRIGSAPETRRVVVLIGTTQIQDFALAAQVAQLETQVITAATGTETRTSETATNVTQAQIAKLPTPSRNFLDLAQLAPGVSVTEDRVNGQFRTVSAGGQAPSSVNLFVDGTSFKNDLTQGGIAGQDASRGNPFPRNAVDQYRVIGQNFKAEYQKASSAVITATTKSGGNVWSGNALIGYQNKSMVQLDTFQTRDKFVADSIAAKNGTPSTFKKPDYTRTLSAISIGGPIIRDRLHVFGSYEGNIQNRANRVAFATPPATGLYPALDTVNLPQYNGNFQSPFREALWFGKLSGEINEKSSAELSFSNRHETDIRDFGGNGALNVANNVHNYNTTVQLKHNFFSGPWLNEALLSYVRFDRGQTPASPGVPHRLFIYPNGSCCYEIGSARSIQEFIQKGPNFRNDLTYTGFQLGGEHVIKGGLSLAFPTYDVTKDNNGTPSFEYQDIRNQGFGNQVYNYNSPFDLQYGTGDPKVNISNKEYGLYLQDDWTPIKQLTLNLGVRWDYETNMLNTNHVTDPAAADTLRRYAANLLVPLDVNRYIATGSNRKTFKGAFQPRVGFSYSVDQAAKTTLFGGWGLYYDRIPLDVAIDEYQNIAHPNFITQFAPRGQAPLGSEVAWNDSYLTANRATLDAISRANGRPELWLIDNEYKLPRSTQWSFGLRQLFSAGFSAAVSYANQHSYDLFTLGLANVKLNANGSCCSTPFDWGAHGYRNIIYSSNDGETWFHAVEVQLDRPYSRPSLDQFGWGAGVAMTFAKRSLRGIDNYGDTFAFPRTDYIVTHSANDEKARIVGNWITDIPFLWGIQWSGLATLGGKYALNVGCRTCDQTGTNRFVPSGFTVPGTFPYRNVDTRIRKDFPSFGRSAAAIGITLDVFNVFNHNNFGTSYDLNDPTTNKNFGRPTGVSSDARRIQIGAELNF